MNGRQTVAILDFGSQYTKVIARRVRELEVYSEIVPYNTTADQLDRDNISAVILSGGPASAYASDSLELDPAILEIGKPILGICYGFNALLHVDGGRIASSGEGEYGSARIKIHDKSDLFKGIPDQINAWMSHGDRVEGLSDNWHVTGVSENDLLAAVKHNSLPIYGTQFHPEVEHTPFGKDILSNFLFSIAGCKRDWTATRQADEISANIKAEVGDKQVLCALSGGVDSSVVATLLSKVLGDQVTCVFIDHGLLRKNEAEQVVNFLEDGLGLNINLFNYADKFLGALKGISNPEQKRKIIGREFIRAFEEVAKQYKDAEFLAQGTLYPDVIESGGVLGVAHTIKSHHNVGGLPADMNFKLIEPLRELFKDEVRKLGRELGMPDDIIKRHPFPGPGLAVRILGELTSERIAVLQEADAIYIDILKETGEYDNIWQAFAVLAPVKTVGVMGDQRTYDYLLALRAVTSSDGMTADWYRMPPEVLAKCSSRIINEVKGVNRVVYDVTSKPPGTIEWE
ncbi:glutamine-hydrolyzing GMP synthase [Candidatus Neomarinimicrobiota bacterium]